MFKRSIQARANPLTEDEYYAVLETVQPREVLSTDSRQEAFERLCDADHIGQKIANEFLRQTVHALGVNEEWINDLAVPLDTHVVQALVKTGAIRLDESERDRRPGEIINMTPGSNPYKRVGYQDVQDAFRTAADDAGSPRIIFDELWLEHRHFIADPLLQSESEFYDLLQDPYRRET